MTTVDEMTAASLKIITDLEADKKADKALLSTLGNHCKGLEARLAALEAKVVTPIAPK